MMRRLDKPEDIDDRLAEGVRSLLLLRFEALLGNDALGAPWQGYFVVGEPGDTVAALEAEVGCPILGGWFDDCRFGDPDFVPGFEWLTETGGCFEIVFITNDDGYAITLLVPNAPDIDPELIAFCQAYAADD